jgi:uncharacterized SAM-binding protein YcdF (DUF218 family)
LFFAASLFVPRAKWLFIFSAFLLYFFSTPFTAKMLLSPLENEFRVPFAIKYKADAVVTLGGGANAYVTDSKLGTVGYKRFMQALVLAKKHDLPLIFAGGGWAERDGITEAGAAKETADTVADAFGFGRPSTSTLNGGFGVIYEGSSENTIQNAQNTLGIMKQNTISNPKIILVTSAMHMKRAKIIFEKNGFDVKPYAVDFKTGASKISYLDALPRFDSLASSFDAMHEYVGILKFFLIDKK